MFRYYKYQRPSAAKGVTKMRRFILAFGLFSLSALPAFADLYLEQTTTQYQFWEDTVGEISHQKIYLKEDLMKIENVETKEVVIIRPDKKALFTLDLNEKIYLEFPLESLKEMARDTTTEVKVEKTGRKKNIMGYPGQEIIILKDGEPIVEMWITEKIDPGKSYKELIENLRFFPESLIEELKKIKGIPLKSKFTLNIGQLEINAQTTVEKISQKVIDPAEFKIPPSFEKIEFPLE